MQSVQSPLRTKHAKAPSLWRKPVIIQRVVGGTAKMTYTKPAITVLGYAIEVIEGGKILIRSLDPPTNRFIAPAYDLDE